MARAMSDYAAPDTGTLRGQAQARLVEAVAEETWFIAGTDDFSVALAWETGGRIVAKGGAAGVRRSGMRGAPFGN